MIRRVLRANYFQGAEEHVGRNTCRCFSVNRSKRGKRERATRGERGKVDEGWPRGSKISGFRGTRHTRSRIFGRVRFLERHGSIEGDREHARPPFFFLSINFRQREQFLPYSPPYIEWKCVQTSYFFHFLFSFSLCLQRENVIRGIIIMFRHF